MQTQAAALAELVFNAMITEETALQFAVNLEELKNQLTHGASHLRAAARPAPAASDALPPPRAPHPTTALPPWAVAALAPPAAPARRPSTPGPVEPMQGHPAAPAPSTSHAPRSANAAELLEKLRRS
jgi:hypothetical protein